MKGKMANRKVFPYLLFVMAAFVSSVMSFAKSPTNFLVIIADDLGFGDVGSLGNETLRTPNIDALASEGAILKHHLAAAPICTPSRSAILTGRYPVRSGMTPSWLIRVIIYIAAQSGLPSNETTFARILQRSGYRTGLIGKWHLGVHGSNEPDWEHHPNQHGFDHFYGLPLTNLRSFAEDAADSLAVWAPRLMAGVRLAAIVGPVSGLVFFQQKRIGFCALCLIILASCLPVVFLTSVSQSMRFFNCQLMRQKQVVEMPIRLENLTLKLVSEGKEFLQRQSQDTPFLLMMTWSQVHTALFTTKKFAGVSKHGLYGDSVEEMDWSVGQIVAELDRLGFGDNTMVYFTSDHGAHIEERDHFRTGGHNGRFKGGKGMGAMEGGIRVPTVIRWPGVAEPGVSVDQPTSQLDVFATIVTESGNNVPSDRIIDGRDLKPLLQGQTDRSTHELLVHYCGTAIHGARYMPTSGSDVWKVHYFLPNVYPRTAGCGFLCGCYDARKLSKPLLYNLRRDPYEDHPIDTNTELYERIVAKINAHVSLHKQSVESVPDQYDNWRMAFRPWLQPLCPKFPYYTCMDEKFPF